MGYSFLCLCGWILISYEEQEFALLILLASLEYHSLKAHLLHKALATTL